MAFNLNEMLQTIWEMIGKYFKTIILPAIGAFLLFPVKAIFEFKGVIVKQYTVDDKNRLCFEIYCTKDTIKNIGFCVQVYDTSHYQLLSTQIPYLASVPTNSLLNADMIVYGNDNEMERSFCKTYISKGNYKLLIPLKNVKDQSAGIKEITKNDFRMDIQYCEPPKAPSLFNEQQEYHWYYWIFFNIWWCILSVFVVLAAAFILTKRKNINHEKN